MKKLLALFFAAATITCSASTRYLFTISHTDNTQWQFTSVPPRPENPTMPAITGTVGTNVAVWAGHAYTISPPTRSLLVDGVPVGVIHWNGNIVAVSAHYGWVIANGQGYLATQYNDGDPTIYLFQLNIVTAQATFIDIIGPFGGGGYSVSGMIVQPLWP